MNCPNCTFEYKDGDMIPLDEEGLATCENCGKLFDPAPKEKMGVAYITNLRCECCYMDLTVTYQSGRPKHVSCTNNNCDLKGKKFKPPLALMEPFNG